MSTNPADNVLTALIRRFDGREEPPTREEISELANVLAPPLGYDGNVEPLVREAMQSLQTRMGAGESIIDRESLHDEGWIEKRDDIEWTYTTAYETMLVEGGWPSTVVNSISMSGESLLRHLQDPKCEGKWDRRGLVIGNVQSGKTANYIELLARAADAGYKFLIVIAGIHNNLRKQTQERVDEGFVGRNSDPDDRRPVGVGRDPGFPKAATLTNIRSDFTRQTAERSGWELNDFRKPVVLIIKKNVSVLGSLYTWLKDMNTRGGGSISDVPMLMIDDEADNASINTNKEDLDPTRTNAMLREILGLFDKSCYVGYTATPFANIFINPEAYDDDVREELFPKHFIYALDAPNTYFGPGKVFLDEERGERILRPISDAEEYIPQSHKNFADIPDLPPSLYRAMRQFVIIRTLRNLRGHTRKHCSMMINVSRFVSVQNEVRRLVDNFLVTQLEAIKMNYARATPERESNRHMYELKEAFEEDFHDTEYDWAEVRRNLFSAVENMKCATIHGQSGDTLDYQAYEKNGEALTVIAVGGLSLSRGLTIEGLCVSYMYRNTKMYDTLMQMGRWFGYRPDYEDLCRVHLSQDSIDWYAHIAEASDDLRQQISQMRQDGLSPKEFGLYVRAHPDSLMITAADKMRSGQTRTVRQNLSDKLIESYLLPRDEKTNAWNEEVIAAFWRKLATEYSLIETGKGLCAKDVPTAEIEDFLLKFKTVEGITDRKNASARYLEYIRRDHPLGDVLLISLPENGEDRARHLLGSQERKTATVTGNGEWRLSRSRVASRGDEKLGLGKTPQEQLRLEANARDLVQDKDPKKTSDHHYREIRRKPLLMLHSLYHLPDWDERARVPAFGISFPPGDYSTEVEVVVNKTWIKAELEVSSGAKIEVEDDDS